MTKTLDVPVELGDEILKRITETNPELAGRIGFLLVAVTHGQPLQTISNIEDGELVYLTELTYRAVCSQLEDKIAAVGNPQGSA